MEELELVYWFTDEFAQKHVFQCDWAQIGCENVLGEFEALADGEYALHMRFSPGSGTLPAGQESGEIKVRFNRMDWSEFSQADDYSFATPNAYQEWEKVALYWRGERVWGRPPDWTEAPLPKDPSPLAPATSLPANPETPEAGVADSGRITMVAAIAVAALFVVAGFVIALAWLGRRGRDR